MKRMLFSSTAVLLVSLLVLLSGCNQSTNTQIANPASVKCVDDGGILNLVESPEGMVGMCTLANGQICEEWQYFKGECPQTATGSNDQKRYVGRGAEGCVGVTFKCEGEEVPFSDDTGCGCVISGSEFEPVLAAKNYCAPVDREGDACTADMKAVCGWFNPDIKCIKYPCGQRYSNSCNACHDTKVLYWTDGECPA